jgi:hypothetical protein
MTTPSTPSPFRSVPPPPPASRRPPDLRTAQEHHKAGRLGEAESAYRRWLGLHAADAAALHGLGLVNHQAGRQHEAVALLRQAVRTAGNPAVGAVGAAGQGPVVGPTVTYDDDGATIVAETIDTEAAAYEGSLTVDVEPATPTIGLTASGSVDQGCAASLEIDYCDPQGLSDDTLVVDWGDGQQQSLAASSTVDLTHAYANGGTKYTVTVAADSPAGPVSNTTGIDVVAPWSAPADYCESIDVVPGAAVEGSPATVDFTAGGNDGRGGVGSSYTIDWGDSTTSAAGGTRVSEDEFDGSGTHTYSHAGQYLVRVTDESDGASGSSFINVTYPGPVLAPIPDQTLNDGDPLTISTTFSNAEPGDYSQAYVNWGDGTGSHPAAISGNTITASLPSVSADIDAAALLLAVGTAAPATQTGNVHLEPATIVSMTATDSTNSYNTVTVTNGTAGGIYVAVGSNGKAQVVFSEVPSTSMLYRLREVGINASWNAAPDPDILTMTPPASPIASQWDYTVTAESRDGKTVYQTIVVHVFKLEITGVDDMPLSTTTPKSEVVGQKVTLSYHTDGDAPPIASATPYSWTIPGTDQEPLDHPTAIENFTLKGADAVPLSSSDLSARTISFYWTAPTATAQSVNLSVKMGTGSNAEWYAASAPFTVDAPRWTFTAATHGNAGVHLDKRLQEANGGFGLYFGQPGHGDANAAGIVWSAQVTAGAGQGGQVSMVQVFKINNTFTDASGNKWAAQSGGAVDVLADGDPFYYAGDVHSLPDGGTSNYLRQTGAPGAPHTDSPSQVLTGQTILNGLKAEFYTASVSESFVDYLIYRPTNGIWVTLATVSWSWAATAAYVPASATYPSNVVAAPAPSIAGVESSTPPQWSDLGPDVETPKKQN